MPDALIDGRGSGNVWGINQDNAGYISENIKVSTGSVLVESGVGSISLSLFGEIKNLTITAPNTGSNYYMRLYDDEGFDKYTNRRRTGTFVQLNPSVFISGTMWLHISQAQVNANYPYRIWHTNI